MRMGLRGMKTIDRQYDTSYRETEEPGKKMKAIEGNMIQAMARLKNSAKKVHRQGSNLEPPVQKSLTLVYAFPTMSTRPCQRRGTRPRGLLGPSGAVLPAVTFSPTINSLSRVDFALGATNSAR